MTLPLTFLATYGPNIKNDLAKLGFISVEHVLGAADLDSVGPLLKQYLGGIDLTALMLPLEPLLPDLLSTVQNATYSFGIPAPLERADYVPGVGLPQAATVPAVSSLADDFPPVRNQGNRQTCSAFATIACLEYNIKKHPPPFGFLTELSHLADLSEQWLYYRAKSKWDGDQRPCTYLATTFKSIVKDGSLPEYHWPYQPNQSTTEDGGPLPSTLLNEDFALLWSSQFSVKEDREINGKSVTEFKAAIDSKCPVAFWVPVYDSWVNNFWGRVLGLITMPVPGEKDLGAHAMCVVGYLDQPEFPEIGGGRFIVRNSWGGTWGLVNPWIDQVALQQGYGTIPYAYVAGFGQEARVIKRGPFE